MFVENSINDYVKGVQSGDPTPGGGSVNALVGSLGAGLTSMTGNITFENKSYDKLSEDAKKELHEDIKELETSINKLMVIVDEDSTAFSGVLEAFKMPKETEEEKEARTASIQEGYKKALAVPMRCAEESLRILELTESFSRYGNLGVLTDTGIGILLAYAAVEGSLFNVRINLKSIKDEDYKKEKEEYSNQILSKAKSLRDELLEIVYGRLEF